MPKIRRESRLGNVNQGLEGEFRDHELLLAEELVGEGAEQHSLHLFAGSTEISILNGGEVRCDLEKHFKGNRQQTELVVRTAAARLYDWIHCSARC